MTLHALAGLLALNAWLWTIGAAVLFALRGWRSWSELARLTGFVYMLGVATNGSLWVWELVAGIPLSWPVIVVTGIAVAGASVVVGVARFGHRLPPRPRHPSMRVRWTSAIFVALAALYAEALFRTARLTGLYE